MTSSGAIWRQIWVIIGSSNTCTLLPHSTKPFLSQCWIIINASVAFTWEQFPREILMISICKMSLKLHLWTHHSLVMPYSEIELNQHWLRYWLVAWWHQAITWTNVDLWSLRSSDNQLKAILQQMPQPSINNISCKMNSLKLCSNFPGANELKWLPYVTGANKLTHQGPVTPCGGSALAQVMACCLMSPSHYQNQCWLVIMKTCGVLLRAISQQLPNLLLCIKSLKIKLLPHLPGANELNCLLVLSTMFENRRVEETISELGVHTLVCLINPDVLTHLVLDKVVPL